MSVLPTLLLLCIPIVLGGTLIQLPNGNHAITGKGCGVTSPIKHLYHIPLNPSEHQCVIIQRPHGYTPKNATKAETICPVVCQELKGDETCDDNCNTLSCEYDGGDCQ